MTLRQLKRSHDQAQLRKREAIRHCRRLSIPLPRWAIYTDTQTVRNLKLLRQAIIENRALESPQDDYKLVSKLLSFIALL